MASNLKTVMMKPIDKVAIALMAIPPDSEVEVTCQGQTFKVTISEEIKFGHKFAVVDIEQGEEILKYGEVIGRATRKILAGEHVHVHNLEGIRGRGDKVAT
ncbi:UxaA family hydrolase [Bacillaceae bacterium C204]|jgi:altronate dehydratase small subunit|uniref:UxaA family hydrolase n=1 Tax=Neobacillus sp. 204 TaxID=3383351 RepID=UPI00397A4232